MPSLLTKYSPLIIAIVFFTLLSGCILTKRTDKTPYPQTLAYRQTIDSIDVLSRCSPLDEQFFCGWAKVNLQPPFTTPIAIDHKRKGKHFQGVRDSVFVRAFVFKMGATKVAYISADLLIVPPTVTDLLDEMLRESGYSLQNIYLTATHTHSSFGAWHNSYVGKIFAGKFNPGMPMHIASCFAQAIAQAESSMKPAMIGHASVPAPQLVVNRLVGEEGRVDSMMRLLSIIREDSSSALMFSFTAHATIFHDKMMHISADWPGATIDSVEKNSNIDFACFSAGAVGSHGPFEHSTNQEAEMAYMSSNAAAVVLNAFSHIHHYTPESICVKRIPVYLREPSIRINKHFSLRTKCFKKLFGSTQLYINTLKIGQLVFMGMPCDFSGELSYDILPEAVPINHELHITSFNGGYGGYITDDKWYERNLYETKTMGWFGPGNGAYFSEIARKILRRITVE